MKRHRFVGASTMRQPRGGRPKLEYGTSLCCGYRASTKSTTEKGQGLTSIDTMTLLPTCHRCHYCRQGEQQALKQCRGQAFPCLPTVRALRMRMQKLLKHSLSIVATPPCSSRKNLIGIFFTKKPETTNTLVQVYVYGRKPHFSGNEESQGPCPTLLINAAV